MREAIHRSMRIVALAICVTSLGLVGRAAPASRSSAAPSIEVRDNAASLLYDLLGDEKNVSKLLIIKRDRRELHEVIKKVSATADAGHKTLERLAREDATLHLKNTALPPGEKAARELESKTTGRELLHASGADFEFKLLLTQAEALRYGATLATVAAENEPALERAKAFNTLSSELTTSYGEVLALLRPGTGTMGKK